MPDKTPVENVDEIYPKEIIADPVVETKRPKWRCRGCKYTSDDRWLGPCPRCAIRYDVVQNRKDGDENRVSLASAAEWKPRKRISSGIPEFDKVLGGGLMRGVDVGWGFVEGASYLIGGLRGVGKSTLLLQTSDGFTRSVGGGKVLYAAGEQNRDDILEMAFRLGLDSDVDVLGNECDLYKIVEEAVEKKVRLLIIDSINVMACDDVKADVGQVAQIDAAANYLTSFGKTEKVVVLSVSHLNKEGDFAGSEKLAHLVDALLLFMPAPIIEDGTMLDGTDMLRELSVANGATGKNRYGDTRATSILEMTPEGLRSPSKRASKIIKLIGGG